MADDLQTLYEDEDLIAALKPSGLLTEGGRGEPDLEALVSQQVGRAVYCCHRLDRPTSGVVLMRKTARFRADLAQLFEERRARKEYWALVEGQWDRRIQRIETRINSIGHGRWGNVASGGKPAVSTMQVLGQATEPSVAWLRVLLKTGRTHQARLHCQWAGCPVLGDTQYGAKMPAEGVFGLHARRLAFRRPGTGLELDIVAEPPSAWEAWLGRFPPRR